MPVMMRQQSVVFMVISQVIKSMWGSFTEVTMEAGMLCKPAEYPAGKHITVQMFSWDLNVTDSTSVFSFFSLKN